MTKQTLSQQLSSAKKKQESASNQVKTLELKIQKENEKSKPKNIWETIKTLVQVYKHLKCDPKKDVIKIDKFNKKEHEAVINLIARMRIAKVYNNNQVPTRKDKRWYPCSYVPAGGSGLVFDYSGYNVDYASSSSAARLAFLSEQASAAYFKNFQKVEEGIIQL